MARTISRSNVASAPLVALAALIAGAMAVRMPQLAVAGTLLVVLFAVRVESRSAGLATLWAYWLLMPALRRVLDMLFSAPAADPLSLLPFVATALLALMELRENRLSRKARAILSMAAVGFLIGVPMGLTVDPAAATFAATAYIAALSAFVIGWGDEVHSHSGSTLERTLKSALPILALYGIAQYFFPLTSWDDNWVTSTDLGSIMAPQAGHIRVFSTLNSPFTFAITLAVGIMFGVAARRRLATSIVVMLPLIVALALTFVRSAWLSLVIGLIVYAAAAKGRQAGKTVAVILVCIAGVVVVGSSNPTTKAFTDRLTSLGDPNSDLSAKERLETTNRLLPQSIKQPLGAGLGQAGLAAGLNESGESGVVEVDDGYLALLYQAGLLAFLLVIWAVFSSVRAAISSVGRAPPSLRPYRAVVLGIMVMLLIAEASADVLFGLPGVIFWYLAGLSVASVSGQAVREDEDDEEGEAAPEPAINRLRASGATL
jgi:putative inorganic carbon (HCO3(-)) transporter